MKKYLKKIYDVSKSIVKGMLVTFKYLFTHAITVQYPKEKLLIPERFRGMLIFDKETCTMCNLCVRACPSECIILETKKDETTGRRLFVSYTLLYGRCNFCGLCEESCPVKGKAIKHTKEYEVVFYNREQMIRIWK